MKKKVDILEAPNFCDPADWCELFDAPVNPDSNTNEVISKEYVGINASERQKVINNLTDKRKSS